MPDVQVLRDLCRRLLQHIQDTFAGVLAAHGGLFSEPRSRADQKPSGLRLISSLAEGADQWVASEAERLGFELQVVLPFDRSEYEKDFADASARDEYRRLCGLATAVFELDGCRERSGDSYLAAGQVMLNQSDLLIALWDGKREQGTGGTGQIIREALRRGIPTIWVNWQAPAEWHLLQPGWRLLQQPVDVQGDWRLLSEQIVQLLLPPALLDRGQRTERPDLRHAYFAETRRSWTPLGGWWVFFRELLRLRWFYLRAPETDGKTRETNRQRDLWSWLRRLRVIVPKCRVAEFVSVTQADWVRDWPAGSRFSDSIIRWVEDNYMFAYK